MRGFEKSSDGSGEDSAAKTLGLSSSEKKNRKVHGRCRRPSEAVYRPETAEADDFYKALEESRELQEVSEVEAQYPENEKGELRSNGILNPSIRVMLGEEDAREDVDQIMERHGYTSI